MKPFDIEAAKRGEPVCTADGREVKLYAFDSPCSWSGKSQPIVGVMKEGDQWRLVSWCSNGLFRWDAVTNSDLRMAPRKETRWVMTWRRSDCNEGLISEAHESEESAKNSMRVLSTNPYRHSFSINPIEVEV